MIEEVADQVRADVPSRSGDECSLHVRSPLRPSYQAGRRRRAERTLPRRQRRRRRPSPARTHPPSLRRAASGPAVAVGALHMDNPRRLNAGELIAQRFVIESHAKAGGMGTVYRARDRVSGVRVAVKVLLDDGLGTTRFAQEARVLAELEHPAIVRYVAHGSSDDGHRYLVMEWLEGEDLAARLARGPLSIDEAVAVGRQVAEGLAAAHTRGVVHRDVKPANVFLEGRDAARVKLLDFGIARRPATAGCETTQLPVTRTGAVIGTVGYMSPEQARGSSEVDARTDVFALGCVLFECLTGRPAFSGVNPVAVLAKVLLEDAPRARTLRREIPVALDDLVARLLSRDPSLRPRDAGAALRALAGATSSRVHTVGGSAGGLADREQRFVSIVLARGVPSDVKLPGDPIALGASAPGASGRTVLYVLRGFEPATEAASIALELRAAAPDAAIAIASGRVDATDDGSLGPVIDGAAALDARASEVVADERSITLLLDRFELTEREGRRVLVGPARRTPEPRTLLGVRTPFVGRDKELALLIATFEECTSESVARAVLVTAPAGQGKSRLQHELVARVRDGATLLFARGDPMGAGAALGLAQQLVRSAIPRLREGEPTAKQHEALRAHLAELFHGEELDRTSETLGELIGAPAASAGPMIKAARSDPRVLGSLIRRAFTDWLGACCERGPMLVAIEDLHWGDRGSISYLEDVLRANAARPFMLFALARPEIHDLFPDVWARAGVQELRLAGLTKRSAERLVRAVLPQVDEPTVARLVARADGNAFCLEELIRHVADGARGSLPETVLALAEARLSRLDPARRRVLRAASVFGEVCWDAAVAALLDDERASAVLGALVDDEVLVPRAPSRFEGCHELAFRHGLLREVAYSQLTDEDRALAHGRAADWLARAGEHDAHLLADHLERSDDPRRAITFLERAVERASETLDYGVAQALAERAVRLGAEGDCLGRLSTAMAMIAASRGDWENGARHGKRAYGLLTPGTADAYAAAACALFAGAHAGDFELAPQIVQDLVTTEPAAPSGAYGLALQIVVALLDDLGQGDTAWLLIERGRRFAAERADCDPVFLGWLDYGASVALARRDRVGEWLAAAKSAATHFRGLESAFGAALARFGWGVLYAELGHNAMARRTLEDAAQVFRRGGQDMFVAWCAITEAWSHWDEHRPDLVYASVTPYLSHHADFRHARALAALASLDGGELARAEEHVACALDGLEEFLVTPWVRALVHATDAATKSARGRHDDALTALSRASSVAGGMAPPYLRSLFALLRIDALLGRGDVAAAREALAGAVARIERNRASLPEEYAAGYVAVRPNARTLALAREHGQSP
ncbi:protein kinase [Myxococcota bacterium]|nr:protein kinase [Myxococcota bacterium]